MGMRISIYSNDDVVIKEVIALEDSSISNEILGGSSVSLYFSLPDFLFIPTGSYIYVNGVKYILLSQNKITLIHERMYEYIVVFESGAALLSNVRVRNLSDNTLFFPYTASAEDHLSLIVSNLNRAYIGYNWSVGECDVDNIEKYLQYNYVDCLSALNALADIFNTEWEITNNVISLHKVEYNTDDPVELSYGIGNGARSEIARNTSSMAMTSVFTQGGSRNIDASKYGSSVLLLPKSVTFRFDGCKFEDEDGFAENKSRSYTTDSIGTIITSTKNLGKQINEGVIDCSDIYPEESHYVVDFEYRSSELFWLTLDIPENVDYSDYVIIGKIPNIVFQDGDLAGKKFKLRLNSDGSIAAVKKYTDSGSFIGWMIAVSSVIQDGATYPDFLKGIVPKEGDIVKVFDISLPDEYICDNDNKSGSSWDMLRRGIKYLYNNEDDIYSLSLDIDPIWARKNWDSISGKFIAGGYVKYTNSYWAPNGIMLRILSINQSLSKQWKVKIVLGNGIVGGGILNTFQFQITNQSGSLSEQSSNQESLEYQVENPKGNYVTLSTAQTVTGDKTFASDVIPGGQKADGTRGRLFLPSSLGTGAVDIFVDTENGIDGETPVSGAGGNAAWEVSMHRAYAVLNVSGERKELALYGHRHAVSEISGLLGTDGLILSSLLPSVQSPVTSVAGLTGDITVSALRDALTDTDHLFVTSAEKSLWTSKWTWSEEAVKAVKVDNAVNADKLGGVLASDYVRTAALEDFCEEYLMWGALPQDNGSIQVTNGLGQSRSVSLHGHHHGVSDVDTGDGWDALLGSAAPSTLSGWGIKDAYTKTQVSQILGNYLPLAGGTMTGAIRLAEGNTADLKGLTVSTGERVLLGYVGDDTYLAQQAGTTRIRSGATNLLHWRNGTDYAILDAYNYASYTVTKTGGGASGTWGINISGNAASATKSATREMPEGTDLNGLGAAAAKVGFANYYKSGGISIENGPADISDAAGLGFMTWRIAAGYSAQLLAATTGGGMRYRTVNSSRNTVLRDWAVVLDSLNVDDYALTRSNYTSYTYPTTVAKISDLHSSWGTLLKAAPSVYVTRWPTAAEVGAYTKAQVDTKLAAYLPLAGGTMSGAIRYVSNSNRYLTLSENGLHWVFSDVTVGHAQSWLYCTEPDGSGYTGMGVYGTADGLNYIYLGGSYTAPWIALRPSGNVGIGVTSPSYRLHVGGSAYVNGTVYAASSFNLTDSNGRFVFDPPSDAAYLQGKAGKRLVIGGFNGTTLPQLNLISDDTYATGDFRVGGKLFVPSSLGNEVFDIYVDTEVGIDGETPVSGGGLDVDSLWTELSGSADGRVIAGSHIPLATSSSNGGIRTGYSGTGKNYPVKLSSTGQAYVSVPWENTTYSLSDFGITATAEEINKLDGMTASKTELNYLDGVTSSIQTQLNNRVTLNTTQTISGLKTFARDAASVLYVENTAATSTSKYSAIVFQRAGSNIGIIAAGFDTNYLYRANPAFSTMYTILDTGNYTSALDSRYVKKSGDTMTGALTLGDSSRLNLVVGGTTRTAVYDDGDYTIFGDPDDKTCVHGSRIIFQNAVGSNGLVMEGDTFTFKGNSIWHAGNDGSGSGLDADLLDGTHKSGLLTALTSNATTNLSLTVGGTVKTVTDLYATYLEGQTLAGTRRGMSFLTSPFSAAGWYRVYTSADVNTVYTNEVLLHIGRTYSSPQNEHYSFSICVGYNGDISITQLSGVMGGHLITKIRVVWDNSQKFYIDIYSAASSYNNTYGVTGQGNGTFSAFTSGAAIPDGYTAYEFATVDGCKSDRGFTGALSGNATSATKLQISRTLWGRPFDGTGNVSGAISSTGNITPSAAGSYNIGTASLWYERIYGRYIDTASGYNLRLCTGGVEHLSIQASSGNVGIGVTSPAYKLHVIGSGYFSSTLKTASELNANTVRISATSAIAHLAFSRANYNYMTAPSGGGIAFVTNGKEVSGDNTDMYVGDGRVSVGGSLSSEKLFVPSSLGNEVFDIYVDTEVGIDGETPVSVSFEPLWYGLVSSSGSASKMGGSATISVTHSNTGYYVVKGVPSTACVIAVPALITPVTAVTQYRYSATVTRIGNGCTVNMFAASDARADYGFYLMII